MKAPFLFILAVTLLQLNAFSQSPCPNPEIIVQLKPGEAVENLLRQLNQKWPTADFRLERTLSKRFNFQLLGFDCQRTAGFDLSLLRNEAAVISANWDSQVTLRQDTLVPNDPLFQGQWNLTRIDLPNVWPISQGGFTPGSKEIVVAVIDEGFAILHPDLKANFWRNPNEDFDGNDDDANGFVDDVYGWNFTNNSPIFPLTSSHGTSVAGIIGAEGNNGEGVSGVNWKVKIMPLHFVKNISEAIQALDYVLDMRERYNASSGQEGAFIVAVNMSFGKDSTFCSEQPVWAAMFDPLGKAGVLSVAATANENWDVEQLGDMPTTCPSEYLITVTNTDSTDVKREKAAYGKKSIDLSAPGYPILTTDIHGNYRSRFDGTSAACPHVSGTIALMYSLPCLDFEALTEADPSAAARLVRDAILKGVDRLPSLKNITVTGGRLNAYNSMKYLHSYCIAKPKEREQGNFGEIYIGKRDIVSIYPNPATDKLNITFTIPDFQLLKFRIFNTLGQEMQFEIKEQTKPFESQVLEVDVSKFAAGTYFVNIFDLNQKIAAKFVKL